jgi:hypothetical protein
VDYRVTVAAASLFKLLNVRENGVANPKWNNEANPDGSNHEAHSERRTGTVESIPCSCGHLSWCQRVILTWSSCVQWMWMFYNNSISGYNVCVRVWNSSVVLPLVTSLICADCRTVRLKFRLLRSWRTLQAMNLIMRKIHVAPSSLELKVFIVMGKLGTVACVAMATEIWRFQLLHVPSSWCLWMFSADNCDCALHFDTVPCNSISQKKKKHANQTSLYWSQIFSLTY